MRFALIVILFLVEACVSNPYDDHRLTTEKESQKYPEQAEHIRQQHDEWANRTRLNRGPNDSYIVEQEKVSGSAFGGPNAAIHLGSNTYKYHHKINLTLVCEKDAFIPKPYSKKNIKWKLNNSLTGEAQTLLDGKLHIYVKTDSTDRFSKLTILTDKHSYDVHLTEFPMVELNNDECL